MFKSFQIRLRSAVLMGIASVTLIGCGIRGNLKTPPPLWGEDLRQTDPSQTQTDPAPSGATQTGPAPTAQTTPPTQP